MNYPRPNRYAKNSFRILFEFSLNYLQLKSWQIDSQLSMTADSQNFPLFFMTEGLSLCTYFADVKDCYFAYRLQWSVGKQIICNKLLIIIIGEESMLPALLRPRVRDSSHCLEWGITVHRGESILRILKDLHSLSSVNYAIKNQPYMHVLPTRKI